MKMHNPPHPGEFIFDLYMQPLGHSCRFLADKLNVSPSTLNRILKGKSAVSPEMALRLSHSLGRTPESWLALQNTYDLWQASQTLDLSKVQSVNAPSSPDHSESP